MNVLKFGRSSSSFGIIGCPCKLAAEDFQLWQKNILREWGFTLNLTERNGTFGDALNALLPRTAPISTKYLFWPLDENWTLYFDNGVNGTDAAPPSVLSSRLGVDSIRVVLADEVLNSTTGQKTQYRATIFEYYSNGVERRHIFVANDGGKWKFGQSGAPFLFENTAAYKAKAIQDRFTNQMLIDYLVELQIDLGSVSNTDKGLGYLLTKHGVMPASFKEFND